MLPTLVTSCQVLIQARKIISDLRVDAERMFENFDAEDSDGNETAL
jgi:hypothetical protein